MPEPAEFPNDLLRGASEVAQFLYGDRTLRRRVYHVMSHSRMPHFRIGSMICARKSVLHDWISARERGHANDNHKQAVVLNRQRPDEVTAHAPSNLADRILQMRTDLELLCKELDVYLADLIPGYIPPGDRPGETR